MNKKLLCAALLCGMGMAHSAMAQEFDDRWYVSAGTGVNFQDKDRGTDDAIFGTVGFGKFFSPNWSLDLELNYQNPAKTANPNLWWSQYGASVDARYHFRGADRNWWPYVKVGVGMQRHEEEFIGTNGAPDIHGNHPAQHKDNNAALNLGLGLQADFGRVDLRTEVGARVDFDKVQAGPSGMPLQQAVAYKQQSQFVDLLASVGLTVALGPEPAAPVVAPPPPTPPAPPSCADMDSDGDGVNDCNDRCPGTAAGTAVGPDGCAVPVSIDLKGVNFDFDKSTLRPDAVAILNEAVEILKRYPQMNVEVAGHTDLCGKDAYNQSLSERRARAVYDYMVRNGIEASRLAGPVGYGESRPLENTPQTSPACRSEVNRRTELNVQN
ncbi:hypothetical protein CO610_10120 [Lysobacteraceae bacterium NML95-0200]|nr:hypothetical protein CO610_10120 [Xanthomonadaceae bacterium NML95-0200]